MACQETVSKSEALKLPCDHYYDAACLKKLFLLSLKDTSLMPAECCQIAIPFETAKTVLKNQTRTRWLNKAREAEIKDKIYCPRLNCGKWIPPENINEGSKIAVCKGKHKSCSICKVGPHMEGGRCPGPGEIWREDATLQVIREKEWTRCPRCQYYIDRDGGCRHMRCSCKYQFCWGCLRAFNPVKNKGQCDGNCGLDLKTPS